jgi:hypothetical protein
MKLVGQEKMLDNWSVRDKSLMVKTDHVYISNGFAVFSCLSS